jgi:hypothetical protein
MPAFGHTGELCGWVWLADGHAFTTPNGASSSRPEVSLGELVDDAGRS